MAGPLGEAFVQIRPDTRGFGNELRAPLVRETERAVDAANRVLDKLGDEAMRDLRRDSAVTGEAIEDDMKEAARQGSDSLGKLGATLKRVAVGVGAAFAGQQLFQFGRDAFNMASDVEEATSRANLVFERFAGDIIGMSKEVGDGLSQRDFLDFAGNLGDGFRFALGQPLEALPGQVDESLARIVDIASQRNLEVADVFTAFQGGVFAGETEPLRRLGVFIDENALKARALTEGVIDTEAAFDDLSQQDKALLRLKEFMEQTGQAAGDFANTSDSAANQQRILSEQMDDFKTRIGNVLLPIMTGVFRFLNDVGIPALQRFGDWIGPRIGRLIELAQEAFRAVLPHVQAFADWIGPHLGDAVAEAQRIFQAVLPHIQEFAEWIGPRIGAFIERVIPIYKELVERFGLIGQIRFVIDQVIPRIEEFAEWLGPRLSAFIQQAIPVIQRIIDWLGPRLTAVFQAIGPIIDSVVGFFQRLFGGGEEAGAKTSESMTRMQEVIRNVGEIVGGILEALRTAFTLVSEVVGTVVAAISEHWPEISATLGSVFEQVRVTLETALVFITDVLALITDVITVALDLLSAAWEQWGADILDFVVQSFEAMLQTIEGVLELIEGIINTVMGVITGDWSRAWEGVQQIVDGVMGAIGGIIDRGLATLELAWAVVSDILTAPLEAARDLISTIVNEIKDTVLEVFNEIKDTVGGIWEGIRGAIETVWNPVADFLNGLSFTFTLPRIHVDGIDPFGPFGPGIPGFTIGGQSFDVDLIPPHIPRLQSGAIIDRPTLALIGERGRELVLPVTNPSATQAILGEAGFGTGGPQIHIANMQITDPVDIDLLADRVAFLLRSRL